MSLIKYGSFFFSSVFFTLFRRRLAGLLSTSKYGAVLSIPDFLTRDNNAFAFLNRAGAYDGGGGSDNDQTGPAVNKRSVPFNILHLLDNPLIQGFLVNSLSADNHTDF